MPPRSPLPQRHGLNAAWMRTPDRDPGQTAPWHTITEWLQHKIGEFVDVHKLLHQQRFVYQSGSPVVNTDSYNPNTFVWFHRELPVEVHVPGTLHIVHRDERIIVVDKPPFLSTIPRGQHVRQSMVVRMRDELGLPELSPVHRLDRVTSGLLILATERRWRAPYQMLFQDQQITKTYHAIAPPAPDSGFPVTVRNHLLKVSGEHRVRHVPDGPINAESLIEIEEYRGDEVLYRLTPRTGKTHQLRQHMLTIGAPISGDPLYPENSNIAVDDFSEPLQLLASKLNFIDPIDHTERTFDSVRELPLKAEVL